MPLREDCRLRPMNEEDLELVLLWRNSEKIRSNMYRDKVISIEEHRAWFKKVTHENGSLHFIFEYKGKPVGVVNANQIDMTNMRCVWGFYIGDEEAPKGCGSAMGYLALDYLFDKLGMHRIIGEVIEFNEASLKYHKKLGFIEEGRFEDHCRRKHRNYDVISLAVLADEWHKIKASLESNIFAVETEVCAT